MSLHPLQASGAIAISDIEDEFDAAIGVTFGLGSFYRGGTYVPNKPWNSSIPTSGAISLSNFYGSSAYLLYTTMTVGTSGTGFDGFVQGSYGSLSPATRDMNGNLIEIINSQASNSTLVVQIYVGASDPGVSYFSAISIPTLGIHAFFLTAAATYVYSNPTSTWTWLAAVSFHGDSPLQIILEP